MRVVATATCIALLQAAPVAWSQDQVVSVRDEPRHVAKLTNEFVRVVDVSLPPGDTTRCPASESAKPMAS